MKVYTRKLREIMWALGMPSMGPEFANLYRAALKAGLDNGQAFALVKEAYRASKGYEWELPKGSELHRATQKRQAALHPEGKCAEDLKAEAEGRPSLWGQPEFHGGGHYGSA